MVVERRPGLARSTRPKDAAICARCTLFMSHGVITGIKWNEAVSLPDEAGYRRVAAADEVVGKN